MSGRVVHVNDHVEGAVYIGRAMPRQRFEASPFQNMYRIGTHGTRGECIDQFEFRLLLNARLMSRLPELRGKPLACWCRHDGEQRTPDTICHGDVLVRLLERYTDDEMRAMAELE